jgi:hypothetical protein
MVPYSVFYSVIFAKWFLLMRSAIVKFVKLLVIVWCYGATVLN